MSFNNGPVIRATLIFFQLVALWKVFLRVLTFYHPYCKLRQHVREADMSSTFCNMLQQLATRVSRDTRKKHSSATQLCATSWKKMFPRIKPIPDLTSLLSTTANYLYYLLRYSVAIIFFALLKAPSTNPSKTWGWNKWSVYPIVSYGSFLSQLSMDAYCSGMLIFWLLLLYCFLVLHS